MANWCMNSALVTASTEDEARNLFEAMKAGKACGGVDNVITSQDDEPADDAGEDYAVWDDPERAVPGRISLDGKDLNMEWGSRNEPPIEFYGQLVAAGFKVEAIYCEPGHAFYGFYSNGKHTETSYELPDDLPSEVWDMMGFELSDFD